MGEAELRYQQNRYRRRMQTTVMLGLTGVLLLIGPMLPRSPVSISVFVGLLMVLVVWVGLLAVADMIATKVHYGRLRQHVAIKQAGLHAEARRIRSVQGNGRADDETRET